MHTLGTTATSVFTEDGWTKVVYHSTVVVKWNAETIELNTGGWSSATTKARMNQASNQYGLGYTVSQRNYKWYVSIQTMSLTGEWVTIEKEFDRQASIDRVNGSIETDRLGE
jgi:hypothetical protein